MQRLIDLYPKVVILPNSDTPILLLIIENIKYSKFVGYVGALDGTYILISILEKDQKLQRNQKGQILQNILAAINFNFNFVFILTSQEGLANNGRVLVDIKKKGFKLPTRRYYLVDLGYTEKDSTILLLFRKVRYYLQEFKGRKP